MFRNKIMIRAQQPQHQPVASAFLFRSIDLCLPSPSDEEFEIKAETICWKLSRRWRIACLHQPSQIVLVYQIAQSEAAAAAVKEIAQHLPIGSGEEEEANSSSLVARAVECVLRCVMLDNDWKCIGYSSFVRSAFSSCEERSHLHAINVSVQLEKDDFAFIVAPDVLRFSRPKDVMSTKLKQKFDNGEEVLLEDHEFSTSCVVLPSLHEGHLIGLRKLLPHGQDFERLKDLWLCKHGLELQYEYFMCVQFRFPSPLVLQGSGLAPAPQSIRASKAVQALESFLDIIGAWNFFSEGPLRIEKISSFAIGTTLPVWKKAAKKTTDCGTNDAVNLSCECGTEEATVYKDLSSTLDFRTPKPDLVWSGTSTSSTEYESENNGIVLSNFNLEDTTKGIIGGISLDPVTKTGLHPVEYAPIKRKLSAENRKGEASGFKGGKGNLKPSFSCKRSFAYAEPSGKENALCPKFKEKECLASKVPGHTKSVLPIGVSSGSEVHATEASISNEKYATVQGGSSEHVETLPYVYESVGEERSRLIPGDNCTSYPEKVPQELASSNTTGEFKENKSDEPFGFKKRKANQASDPDNAVPKKKTRKDNDEPDAASKKGKQGSEDNNVIAKIMEYFAKGELRLLTVADLKCFLASRKAKVGGKKEELVQRITELLS